MAKDAFPDTLPGAAASLWRNYVRGTPAHLKLIDAYLVYLLCSGIAQFVYVCLVGTFPFNAFLAGFGSAVAAFVLAVSLRMQTNPENKGTIAWNPQRAFADFVVSNVVLQFITVHFLG
ncbi:oligosaccharyltransferase complex subunit epsilon [Blastocladiella emersonii ATCC 22665]|nr:oligosaccharyltransferase complex subunit epsilon [Blastocladiella emersonii ATCC 22665]